MQEKIIAKWLGVAQRQAIICQINYLTTAVGNSNYTLSIARREERFAMNSQRAYKSLRELLQHKLSEVDAMWGGKKALAERMGVEQSTVGRWAKQMRGENIPLKSALRLAEGLQIPMEDVIRAMMPDDAETMIRLYQIDKEMLPDMLKIALHDHEAWKLLKGQIKFLASKIDPPPA